MGFETGLGVSYADGFSVVAATGAAAFATGFGAGFTTAFVVAGLVIVLAGAPFFPFLLVAELRLGGAAARFAAGLLGIVKVYRAGSRGRHAVLNLNAPFAEHMNPANIPAQMP